MAARPQFGWTLPLSRVVYASAWHHRDGPLYPAKLGAGDHSRFAYNHRLRTAGAAPGLPDGWQAAPAGRLPDALYREMAPLDPAQRTRRTAQCLWFRGPDRS